MLGTDRPIERGTEGGVDAPRVARAFRERVLPCGVETVHRLEAATTAKLSEVRRLETVPDEEFPSAFRATGMGVVSARAHSAALVRETPARVVREILYGSRVGRFGPAELPELADRLVGAPARASPRPEAARLDCCRKS